MGRTLIVLTTLLLAGCVSESASYYIDENSNEHTITVRAEQDYFWDDELTLTLSAARMPDCQRRFSLAKVPMADLAVELFSSAENTFTLRVGSQVWQVETQNCTQLQQPAPNAFGEPLGVFRLGEENKMVFEKAVAAPVPAPVAEPAPAG